MSGKKDIYLLISYFSCVYCINFMPADNATSTKTFLYFSLSGAEAGGILGVNTPHFLEGLKNGS